METPEGVTGSAIFKPRIMVLEEINVVGPALQAELASYTTLTGIRGQTYWIDANRAGDAEMPRTSERSPGVNAIVPVGGIRMRISEAVSAAQAILDVARTGT
ncbi:MAG: hypothetical protein R8G34_08180 [Paracoccaceae bacterium]|nr:hypothetical protein [Paracoccaceae bacterium]